MAFRIGSSSQGLLCNDIVRENIRELEHYMKITMLEQYNYIASHDSYLVYLAGHWSLTHTIAKFVLVMKRTRGEVIGVRGRKLKSESIKQTSFQP